jgi:hypothetical protein
MAIIQLLSINEPSYQAIEKQGGNFLRDFAKFLNGRIISTEIKLKNSKTDKEVQAALLTTMRAHKAKKQSGSSFDSEEGWFIQIGTGNPIWMCAIEYVNDKKLSFSELID